MRWENCLNSNVGCWLRMKLKCVGCPTGYVGEALLYHGQCRRMLRRYVQARDVALQVLQLNRRRARSRQSCSLPASAAGHHTCLRRVCSDSRRRSAIIGSLASTCSGLLPATAKALQPHRPCSRAEKATTQVVSTVMGISSVTV